MKSNYIASSEAERSLYLKPQFHGKWILREKVPVESIQIDRSLFAWNNPIYPEQVNFLIDNFNQEFWSPILVNSNLFLLDGQHRLAVAKHFGLTHIDILIEQDEEMIKKRINTCKQERVYETLEHIF